MKANINTANVSNDPNFLQQLLAQLYNSDANVDRTMSNAMKKDNALKSMYDSLKTKYPQDLIDSDSAAKEAFITESTDMFKKPFAEQDAFQAAPFKTKVDLGNGTTGNGLTNTLGALGANIKAHPLASLGVGALGASNIAGLLDDDKIGGQLVGGLGGGLLAGALKNLSPMSRLAIGLGGGTVGALFDKLRAKKEAEQEAYGQYM